ncbi:porin [Cupriavidus lacunae]|uniref:Porin domain-containing protein n=1 Tax=Cupriavidus lacunae TaxID=2666307 RepID=A0A370NL09_9BURK|nr:porin [Cupriavidus lacunae]RDK06277.1 hypothetical protein DN412_32360 [Cupriavidus lacunae]
MTDSRPRIELTEAVSQSKKKLLYGTVAVLAPLLGAPVAVHAVELYGIIDSYMGSTKASGEERASIGLQSGGLSTSFWGMTGTEDLGKGLNATFRIEGFFLGDTGQGGRYANDPMFSRNAYVGLSGRFGEVRLGKLSNPTFLLTGQFDPFGSSTKLSPLTTVLWNPQYGRYIAGDTGWSKSVSDFMCARGHEMLVSKTDHDHSDVHQEDQETEGTQACFRRAD